MNVKNIMSQDIRSLSRESSVINAAQTMRSLDVGVVPVVDGDNRVVGVVTDRDIVLRCVAESCDANSKRINEVMSKTVLTVNPDTDIEEAAKIMAENQVRRLPVVESGSLVGMLSLGDIATDTRCEFETDEIIKEVSEP
jgi:CBS domain-containing protein